MERSKELGIIHGAIEKLCDDENITEEELRLVREYLESLKRTAGYFRGQNNIWEMFGLERSELSGDGFARDIVDSIGEGEFIKTRSKIIGEWEEELAKIEAKLEKIKS